MAKKQPNEKPAESEPTNEPVKEVPAHKRTWEEMKQDPELKMFMSYEGYDKLNAMLLYKILKKLDEKK